MARFVPFAAVAGANCVNLPFMRWNEIRDGIAVFDKDGQRVGGESSWNDGVERDEIVPSSIRIIDRSEKSDYPGRSVSYRHGCTR